MPDGVVLPELEGRVAFFAGFDNVKFRRQVIPGDRLDMKVELIRLGSRIWKVHALATVDGQKAAQAEMTEPWHNKLFLLSVRGWLMNKA